MTKTKISAEEVARLTLRTMLNNPFLIKQAKLNILFAKETITLEDYFTRQKSVDDASPAGEEYTWEQLEKADKEFYDHEIEHKKVSDKYGVQVKVFRAAPKTFYVERVNFEEVMRKQGYTLKEVKAIEMEGLFAPHVSKEEVETADKLDILGYEILKGNIKKITFNDIANAFKKYNWVKKT
ncbi:MAG: hypothetical protein ACREBJ_01550 [Nitrosotalea sp.]